MPTVVVSRLAEDAHGVGQQLLGAIEQVGLAQEFDRARGVFIKPNLTYPHFKAGVTTRRDFIAALVGALRTINGVTRIYIGEGEGGYNSFSMTNALRDMGFYGIGEEYPNVEIVNLSELPFRIVHLKAKGKPYALSLPELFFSQVDFSITCPVPKVHCMTGLTLSLKNQWGCVPDTMRLKNHYVFDEIISQVSDVLGFRFAFLDGKYGLDRNGPLMGEPLELGWFVASNSLGAFDRVVAGMMGFDWRRIRHLKMGEAYGLMPTCEEIAIIGDPDALMRRFTLERNAWNYLALAGFRSKYLTHLFYFSVWAKLLHDVMYTFRKRPINA